MPAPKALATTEHGVQRRALPLLALLAGLALILLGAPTAAHAEGSVPEKPDDLISVAEGAEVSAPDMERITSLMTGLNGAHEEQVGVIITDEEGADAQALADKALTEWGLDEGGAVMVIAVHDYGVGLAVSEDLTDRVSEEDQNDVVNKVGDGIGQYGDWAKGVQSGATRLFLYIEDQGLGGGTDDHGHVHAEDDPAVEEVPEGEAPEDAYVEGEQAQEEAGIGNTSKIVLGAAIVLLAGAGLFLIVRRARGQSSQSDGGSDSD